MSVRYSPSAIEQVKAHHSVAALAGDHVRLRKGSSKYGRAGFTGPCPICCRNPNDKSKACFECSDDAWVCAKCPDGGDLIRLYARIHGLDPRRDFIAILDRLGGRADAFQEDTPAVARRRGRADFASGVASIDADPLNLPPQYDGKPHLIRAYRDGWRAAAKQDQAARAYRERERKRLFDFFWRRAERWPGTPVETYLTRRGLLVPDKAQLRFLPDAPYFKDGREDEPVLLYRGPAMLAALIDAPGFFRGVHFTWFDLADDAAARSFKALIVDPETGKVMPAKKARGSKQGCTIDLGCVSAGVDRKHTGGRMIVGEGIETTLAVYTALHRTGRLRPGDLFAAGIDLGNLAGRAIATVRHPTLKDAAGRARRVPGSDPDMTAAAMVVPAGVTDLVLLGDGDSDPFTTQQAMARACRRHAASGRSCRVIWPPQGKDFNDWILE